MGIGKNIKTITKNKGITLLELSKKSGVPINTIYTLTREDPDNATMRTIDRLAEALGVDSKKLRMDPKEYEKYERQELIYLLDIDPDKYDTYSEDLKRLIIPHKNGSKLLHLDFLKVPLPVGVHLVEDYEDALTQIVYPEGTIDVTYEEMDRVKENIERYAAFTLESFKQEHKDRIRENKKDDPTT